ncbi:flagellar biosynthesis repressor FlbT [Frigidibacter sp. MR17.24]|uniref:flagellar biosynthesis repressor FlbT n=1 Tax=Frigidibacter sp. MR17.24 TaxID=3127345 RepID=UPI003012B1D9
MALKLTLKPNERVVINGCVIRNADRRQVFVIENRADVIRENELIDEPPVTSPAAQAYFMIQCCVLQSDLRDSLGPEIRTLLAKLVPVFRPEIAQNVFEAASNVSIGNYYAALRAMRPVMRHEETVLGHIVASLSPAPPEEEV